MTEKKILCKFCNNRGNIFISKNYLCYFCLSNVKLPHCKECNEKPVYLMIEFPKDEVYTAILVCKDEIMFKIKQCVGYKIRKNYKLDDMRCSRCKLPVCENKKFYLLSEKEKLIILCRFCSFNCFKKFLERTLVYKKEKIVTKFLKENLII